MTFSSPADVTPLDRARKKAYWRLLPILFLAYVIAFVDRANVAFAKLTMVKDLPGFDNSVIGFGAGIFFIGYFLLEIPGSVIVERWSARLWISRIMITWGIMAAMTAFVHLRIPGFTHVAEIVRVAIVAAFRPLAAIEAHYPGGLATLAGNLVEGLGGRMACRSSSSTPSAFCLDWPRRVSFREWWCTCRTGFPRGIARARWRFFSWPR